ncbi:MAG: prepilin-type N-terminal cleavage/methylation domain-containing protein, partial [Verrucomicrobiota bacterium]
MSSVDGNGPDSAGPSKCLGDCPEALLFRPASRAKRGFTLVEVLLALGIVSFAFMALCGML